MENLNMTHRETRSKNALERDNLEYCEFAPGRSYCVRERLSRERGKAQWCRYLGSGYYCPYNSAGEIRRVLEERRKRIRRQ